MKEEKEVEVLDSKEDEKESKHKKKNKKDNLLNDKIELLENKVSELDNKNKRLQAEFINYQNRKEIEIQKICEYDGESVLKEILPTIDNFERAIKLDDRDLSDEVSQFLSGFKMIYTSLLSTLEKLGVKEMNIDGKEFDPSISQAVLVEEDTSKPAGVVLEVLQKGYMYKDKILRQAMVKVNK